MTNGNPSGGKISWGMIAYSVIALVILYNLYPNSDGVSGGIGETFLALLLVLGIIISVSVAVFVYKTFFVKSSKKKTDETDKKGTKTTVSVPRNVTFWTDWKTYVTIILGYLLLGIIQTQHFFTGGPCYRGIIETSGGLFYLPISGIFYAVLFATFIYLMLLSVNPFVITFGLVFGVVFTVMSIFCFWFIPYNETHIVIIQFIGNFRIPFPPDPLVSWKWIVVVFGTLYAVARIINRKNHIFSQVPANMVLIIAIALFLPQLFYL